MNKGEKLVKTSIIGARFRLLNKNLSRFFYFQIMQFKQFLRLNKLRAPITRSYKKSGNIELTQVSDVVKDL